MRLVSLVLSIVLVVAACISGAPFYHFIDLPSFIMVFGLTFLGLSVVHRSPFRLIWKGLRGAAKVDDLKELVIVAQTGSRLSIASGWLGFIIGATQMLIGIKDTAMIQPASAVLILTILYGYVLFFLCWLPLEQYCKAEIRLRS